MDKDRCFGCYNNVYNGNLAKECWNLSSAKMINRWKIGTWADPTQPGAYIEVFVPSCYQVPGEHYYENLPEFAVDSIILLKKEM